MLSLAAPEAAAQPFGSPCGTNIGTSEIAIDVNVLRASLAGGAPVLRLYDRTGALLTPVQFVGIPGPVTASIPLDASVRGSCDYMVNFPPGSRRDAPTRYIDYGTDAAPVLFPVTVEIERTDGTTDRFVYSGGIPDLPLSRGSFFNPYGNNADVYFDVREDRVRTSPDDFWTANNNQGRFMDELAPDGGWVFPYHKEAFCAQLSCTSAGAQSLSTSSPFLMPVDAVFVYGQPITKRLTPALSMILPANYLDMNWDESWLTLAFAPGTRLEVASPSFRSSGVTYTSQGPTLGWNGLRVTEGTTTLAGLAIVERVGTPAGSLAPPVSASIIVTGGGRAVLDGARIQSSASAGGLLVSGQGSTALVTGTTLITENAGGPGVAVTAGASATVDGSGVVISGNSSGVVATGTGSRVLVTAGTVFDNDGPGVRASGGGHVDVLRYTGDTPPATLPSPVLLDSNIGGLYASATGKTGGGVVFTGERVYECDPTGCINPSVGQHRFETNNLGPAFDIQSRGGSIVLAQENYWGTTDPNAVERDADAANYVAYLPILTAPPSATGGGVASRGAGSAPARATALANEDVEAAGRIGAGVLALLGQAEAHVQAGDSTGAGARVLSAWALSDLDDDRLAVSEAAGRTLAAVEPAALVSWATGAEAWGLRARAAGLAGQGRTAEAASLAASLAAVTGTDDVSVGHRVRGLGLMIEAAVAEGNAAVAVSSLAALASVDPDGAADLAVSVALAFPDAPVVVGRGGVVTQTGAPAADAGKTTVASDLVLTAGPNPSSGAVRVSLTGVEGAEVAVYDALGRRVAVLHDGPAAAGIAATFDGATFPTGVYVVRAVVRDAAGGISILTRTITVAR